MGARRGARGRGGRRRRHARAAPAHPRRGAGRRCSGSCSRRSPPGSSRGCSTPAHWDELGDGVGRGLEALSGVTLPYAGVDPWPDITLRLGGALLVTLAAVLAAWPREEGRGFPFFALAALLVLVATPVTAIGTTRSLVLGIAIAALTVCFLWLERLPLRPGVGVAVLAGHRARGRAPAQRRGRPRRPVVRLQQLGGGARHAGVGALRVGPLLRSAELEARRARDAAHPVRRGRSTGSSRTSRTSTASAGSMRGVPDRFGPGPEADLDANWGENPQWGGEARVTVRGLRGDAIAGAGTTLSVDAGDRHVMPTFSPGTWQADRELTAGDSYRVRFYAPRPNPLAARGRHERARAASRATRWRCCCRSSDPSCPTPPTPAARPVAGAHARAAAVLGPRPAAGPQRPPRDDRARPPGAAQLAVLADLAARPAPQARRPQPLRVRAPHRPLLRQAASATTSGPRRRRRACRRSSTSCSRARRATASTSRARWRCCCASAGCPRASRPASRPEGSAAARASGSCATAMPTRGSRPGSTASAGSRSTRLRARRPRAR